MDKLSGRVLVIDDDASLCFALEAVLGDAGLTVETCASGAAGLLAFEARGADAVLTDLAMPEMDGLQVLERLRAQDPGVPVVMLTAHGGINFWIGNNPTATGYPKMPPGIRATQEGALRDSITLAERTNGRPMKRWEVSKYWSAQANAYISTHRTAWMRLIVVKIKNFWNAYQYDDLSIIKLLRDDGVLPPGAVQGRPETVTGPGEVMSGRGGVQARVDPREHDPQAIGEQRGVAAGPAPVNAQISALAPVERAKALGQGSGVGLSQRVVGKISHEHAEAVHSIARRRLRHQGARRKDGGNSREDRAAIHCRQPFWRGA